MNFILVNTGNSAFFLNFFLKFHDLNCPTHSEDKKGNSFILVETKPPMITLQCLWFISDLGKMCSVTGINRYNSSPGGKFVYIIMIILITSNFEL